MIASPLVNIGMSRVVFSMILLYKFIKTDGFGENLSESRLEIRVQIIHN